MTHRLRLLPLIWIPGLWLAGAAATAGQTVHVSRFWHNHQPVYWPDWNTGDPNGQNTRVQYAADSIRLKPSQNYGGLSTSHHPENDLNAIFGVDDRRNAYQSGPRNALAALPTDAGFAISYSGSLIDNIRQLGSNNQLGYGPGWCDGFREARQWHTPSGARRMDLVGFTYHHSLAPLLPKPVLRKEIQIFKQAWWKAWGGASALTDHSRGFFPTEMAFSRHIIDVLVDEGYEWVIVPSHHLSRTCPTYNSKANPEGTYQIYSSPPNRADQIGPSPTGGWWHGEPNPGNAAWNVSPYAYQLHRVKYVNPSTGAEKSMIAVPSDDVLSYRFGYANEGIGKIRDWIAPHATDPQQPVLVMPATDGDNAWGGGSSSWFEATPQFFNDANAAGYRRNTPQDFVTAHGAMATPAHVEDGAWIFPEMDYGSPYFLKWIEPPVANAAIGATQRYPGTQIDLETPGFALKFYSYAPLIAGANWCETAEQIWRDESPGNTVEPWKIQAPYDWDGSWTSPNAAELAWHIYLNGLDSGFNYYGGLGNDDEVKPGLATRRTIEHLQPWMTQARKANDRTPPTVLKPQRFPYNPGSYTFGWFNRIPGGDERFLKKMPSEFYLWTHAYDLSGIPAGGVVAKLRLDADGINPLASNQNETYAGGPDVGAWISIPMTRRELPKSREALNAAASNNQIDYFLPSPETADYYFAKITAEKINGFRGRLLDYYIEATDTRGNLHQSEIQHVFVADDENGPPPPVTQGPAPFLLDGVVDSAGYQLANPGMTIHAALRGTILYVATWSPVAANGNDHFILLGDATLATASTPAPWSKQGGIALPAGSPFLAAESTNAWIGWFDTSGATNQAFRTEGGQMEGTIDLQQAFNGIPSLLYLTSLAYQTHDGGVLAAQAPARVTDNGKVDPDECLVIPTEALRDDDANGTYDRLEPGRGFHVTSTSSTAQGFVLSWQCFPGRSYQVESNNNLDPAGWTDIPGASLTAGATDLQLSHVIPMDAAATQRFFRVRLLP